MILLIAFVIIVLGFSLLEHQTPSKKDIEDLQKYYRENPWQASIDSHANFDSDDCFLR